MNLQIKLIRMKVVLIIVVIVLTASVIGGMVYIKQGIYLPRKEQICEVRAKLENVAFKAPAGKNFALVLVTSDTNIFNAYGSISLTGGGGSKINFDFNLVESITDDNFHIKGVRAYILNMSNDGRRVNIDQIFKTGEKVDVQMTFNNDVPKQSAVWLFFLQKNNYSNDVRRQ